MDSPVTVCLETKYKWKFTCKWYVSIVIANIENSLKNFNCKLEKERIVGSMTVWEMKFLLFPIYNVGEISNCLYVRGKGPNVKILLQIKIEWTDGAQFPKRDQSVHARVWIERERTDRDVCNFVVWKGRRNASFAKIWNFGKELLDFLWIRKVVCWMSA